MERKDSYSVLVESNIYLKAFDFIVGKIALVIDFLKVNISIGVYLAYIRGMILVRSEE